MGPFDLFMPAASGTVVDSNHWSFLGPDLQSRKTAAGERVGAASAMQIAAFFDAVRIISEDLATIPLNVYRIAPSGRKERVENHAILPIVNYGPNQEMGAVAFREAMVGNALCWGNAFAEIERNGAGAVVNLWPIHSSRVTIKRDENGDLFYRVASDITMASGKRFSAVDIEPYNMLHVHGMGGDGVAGYSVLRIAAESIGISLAAQTLAGAYFGNGHQVAGILKYPQPLNEVSKQSLREQWAKLHRGASKGGGMAILDRGGDFQRIGIPPNEAQFLETRVFQIEEIARWFRMHPSKLGIESHAKGWSTLEQAGLQHVTECLRPWAVRVEQEIDRKLLDGQGALFIRHEFEELTRGDRMGRANYYRTMISTGALAPNEARLYEGLNPGPDELDQFFMQGAMLPIDKLGQTSGGQPKAAPMDPGRPPEDSADPSTEPGSAVAALRPVFVAAADRILRREAMAVQRKAGKPGFAEWAGDFYRETAEIAGAELAAPVAALFASRGISAVPDIGPTIAAWADESRDCALASSGADLRAGNTPEQLADAILAACLEAMP